MRRTVNTLQLLIFTGAVALGQEPAAPRAFEAASIKPSPPETRFFSMDLGSSGQFRASGATLGDLLMQAYHVESFQIAGGPSWINSARFEITAAADSKPLTPDQRREMLQSLLADRFQVVLHRETKELPVYELILAKGGPKLKQAAAGKCPDPPEMTNPCGGFRIFRRSLLTGNQVTVAQLAQDLSFMLDRLVIDKTAIKGIFDMRLEWTPEATLGRISSEGEPAGSPDGPSIFTAIQEQLGLKLESRRGPTPVLVLDRASKPSDN